MFQSWCQRRWKHLSSVVPGCKSWGAWLKQYGQSLCSRDVSRFRMWITWKLQIGHLWLKGVSTCTALDGTERTNPHPALGQTKNRSLRGSLATRPPRPAPAAPALPPRARPALPRPRPPRPPRPSRPPRARPRPPALAWPSPSARPPPSPEAVWHRSSRLAPQRHPEKAACSTGALRTTSERPAKCWLSAWSRAGALRSNAK